MAGGKREGAGRPPIAPELKKIPSTVKLSRWVTEWLNEQPEAKAVLIERAVIKAYKLNPPR